MSIFVNARSEVSEMWAGNNVDAVYVGETQVWPDVANMAGGIELELPAKDTLDWVRFTVVLNSFDYGGADKYTNFMRFTVDGEDYYINAAPQGCNLVKLVGNVIELTDEQKKVLGDKIGSQLKIDLSCGATTITGIDNNSELVWAMPWVRGSEMKGNFELSQDCSGSFSFEVKGVPSNVVHLSGRVPFDENDATNKWISWNTFNGVIKKDKVEIGNADIWDWEEVPGDYAVAVKLVWPDDGSIRVNGRFENFGIFILHISITLNVKKFF